MKYFVCHFKISCLSFMWLLAFKCYVGSDYVQGRVEKLNETYQ